MEMSAHSSMFDKTKHSKTAFIPTAKYSGGGFMIWGCFAIRGPGLLEVVEWTMNSSVEQKLLETNVRTYVQWLKPGPSWVQWSQTQQLIYN